jgi:hypothetical protein
VAHAAAAEVSKLAVTQSKEKDIMIQSFIALTGYRMRPSGGPDAASTSPEGGHD